MVAWTRALEIKMKRSGGFQMLFEDELMDLTVL